MSAGADKIELQQDTITDETKYRALLAELSNRTEGLFNSPVQVLCYRSYPLIKLSDHKPVSATLRVSFKELQPSIAMKHPQWTATGRRLKVDVRCAPEKGLGSYKTGDWVGLFAEDWVNKLAYTAWARVQKKRKPKGEFLYKVKFSSSAHPGKVMNLQLVYFRSSGDLVGYQNIEAV